MTNQNLNAQIEALLDNINNQEDIAQATQLLHKHFFEKALNAELDHI